MAQIKNAARYILAIQQSLAKEGLSVSAPAAARLLQSLVSPAELNTCQSSIRDWRLDQACYAEDVPDNHQQAYGVHVHTSGSQVWVDVEPEGAEAVQKVHSGLSVTVEIHQGVPCVHVGAPSQLEPEVTIRCAPEGLVVERLAA